MFCDKCGAQIPDGSGFCSSCGQPLAGAGNQDMSNGNYGAQSNYGAQPNYGVQPNYGGQPYGAPMGYGNAAPMSDDEAMRIFLGGNAQYYISKFDEFKNWNKSVIFNICAFLFSGYWFIYRKMYGVGCGILGIWLVLNLILCNVGLYNEDTFGIVMLVIELIVWIAAGCMANKLYMNYAEQKINESKMLPENMRAQFLMSKGGTSALAVVLAVVAVCVINFLIYFFLYNG